MPRLSPEELARMTPQEVLRHHVSGAVARGEAIPIHGITQADCDSAARGLNMLGKRPSELDEIAERYKGSPDFAGQAIRVAAQQIAAVKRRNGAEG